MALVAAVSHLTCCAIGVLSASTPTFRVLAGAVSKLHAHRRDRLGVDEPPDLPLAYEQPNFVLTAAAAATRVAVKVRAPHVARSRRPYTSAFTDATPRPRYTRQESLREGGAPAKHAQHTACMCARRTRGGGGDTLC